MELEKLICPKCGESFPATTERQDLLGEILAQAPSKEVEKVGFHKQGKEG